MLRCIPRLLDRDELEKIRRVVDAGSFGDGKATAGYRAKRVKHNLQLEKTPADAKFLSEAILGALKSSAEFNAAAVPKRIRPPLISRYEPGMEYGDHVDDAIMDKANPFRSDVSVTVFLNDPTEYDGGELTIVGSFGDQGCKLPAGDAVVYPSSSLHRVAPVTRGHRLAAVTWVQSLVRDPAKREILYDLNRIRLTMSRALADAPETDLAHRAYSNLLRRWAEP